MKPSTYILSILLFVFFSCTTNNPVDNGTDKNKMVIPISIGNKWIYYDYVLYDENGNYVKNDRTITEAIYMDWTNNFKDTIKRIFKTYVLKRSDAAMYDYIQECFVPVDSGYYYGRIWFPHYYTTDTFVHLDFFIPFYPKEGEFETPNGNDLIKWEKTSIGLNDDYHNNAWKVICPRCTTEAFTLVPGIGIVKYVDWFYHYNGKLIEYKFK
ncbi:MAG: hypothetical protein A2X61_06605 [Ignavibacteria bacterium GWB2_35_12]|nr:MAG: hypothetical protein A2X61_06605 [Ignavibacteria bacterium GWB2_35_12]OGU91529.1 MAG: hypothetical protein A2220_03860 [Ignavibacteria bacterium RIFOXYA2_FULL_35_10]OGV24811.1 MAG: hypothetical protein A2475_01070 [Ignavibacteria bacterium RIFOXYC2_FULL_35_21]